MKKIGTLGFHVFLMSSAFYSTSAFSATPSPNLKKETSHQHLPAVRKYEKRNSINNKKPLQGKSEELSVSTTRRVRGTKEVVGQKLIATMVPGTNALKALSTLPGISFQSPDAQGMDTWASQFFMHGFQQQQIGVTLDEMPLGEQTYRNYNGLLAVSAISSENISHIDVTQSAGAESSASTNNLGGTLNYVSMDPSLKRGGTIQQSFGSYNTYHTFIRANSGKLNDSGTRFYASYMRNDSSLWKGYGNQFMQQVNAKLLQPIGQSSKITAFFDWTDVHQDNYQDLSPEMLDKVGQRVANYTDGTSRGYITAYNAAKGIYPSEFRGLSSPLDASYYDSATNTTDLHGQIHADFALTDRLRWSTVVYGHSEKTQAAWATPYFPSPNGSPISETVKEPEIQRFGILSSLKYNIARHHLESGVWYENNKYTSPMYAYERPNVVDGVIQGSLKSGQSHWSDPFAKIFNQVYNTNTFTAYFQDTYNPIRNVSLHFGFKSLLNTTRVGGGYINPDYYGAGSEIASGVGLTTAKPFLPHISADWHFLKNHELFMDISENVHAYSQSGYHLTSSPFSISQSAFDVLKKNLHPETAWTFAAGYRYSSPILQASVYGYRTNFNNRLQQITAGSVINPITTVANVGGVTMNGVDAGVVLRPYTGISLSASISYNHAIYDENFTNSGISYATKGKQIVNYPRLMFKSRLSYDIQGASVFIEGNYNGTRNYDYTGDLRMPAYWMANLGASYDFNTLAENNKNFRYLKGLTVAFNVNNLMNTRYIAAMGTQGNPMASSTGAYTYQGLEPGVPRGYYGSLKVNF